MTVNAVVISQMVNLDLIYIYNIECHQTQLVSVVHIFQLIVQDSQNGIEKPRVKPNDILHFLSSDSWTGQDKLLAPVTICSGALKEPCQRLHVLSLRKTPCMWHT